MTPAPLLCALALLAGPATTGTASTETGTPPTKAAVWVNSGGVLLTAFSRGTTIDIPLGVTIPLPSFPTMSFELTYFRWACVGNVSCTISYEQGVFATAGFHFDTEGKGPLLGFFLSPKLQLSGFHRTVLPTPSLGGFTFGAELGLDLGYQWRVGSLYLALMVGLSGGVATHHPSGLYGLLVEWNGSNNTVVPQTVTYVFGINANVLRLGFAF